jgi:hypothetical protein
MDSGHSENHIYERRVVNQKFSELTPSTRAFVRTIYRQGRQIGRIRYDARYLATLAVLAASHETWIRRIHPELV